MGLLGDVFGDIGAIGGALAGGGTDQDAQDYYHRLIDKMGKVDPRILAEQVGPSALGSTGLDSRAAQMDALRTLSGVSKAGGLDAGTRAGLAEATTGANRNAAANRNTVAEHARATGAGRGGTALALQQLSGQQAQGDANAQAIGAAGVASNNRINAAGASGSLAGAVRGGDYQAASATDAINQFNAAMRQSASQATYGNSMDQLSREGQAYGGVYNAGKADEARIARLYQGIGKTIGTAGDGIAGMGGMPTGAAGFDPSQFYGG